MFFYVLGTKFNTLYLFGYTIIGDKMENKSIWESGCKKESKSKVEKIKDIKTDVLIIGGGMTGLTTGYFLMNKNFKTTIIDKGKVGMGVTSKTTGKLSYLQGTTYQDIASKFDLKTSRKYLDSQIEAIKIVKSIVKEYNIECNLEEVDSFIFTKKKEDIDKVKKEMNILNGFDIKCSEVSNLPINFPIEYGIKVSNTYTFHPLKYINGLKKNLEKEISFYEDIMALEITQKDGYYDIRTDKNMIKAKYVVIACHYPFFIKPGFVPLKTYIKREYVNVSKYDYDVHFSAISVGNTLHSIRFYEDYLIYGSNQQRLTNKIDYNKQFDNSKIDFKRLFSKEPEFSWINQDLMTNDGIPLIGIMDKKQPNLLLATGFNAWGMTNGTIAGKVISDMILNKYSPYKDLFNPTRFNMGGFIESIIGGFHYSKVYAQTTFKKNAVTYSDRVYTIRIDGKHYGVYLDDNKKRHIVNLLCPHMKCHLVFNIADTTWDCPCHGSRFNIDGEVIEGPANYSIKFNEGA